MFYPFKDISMGGSFMRLWGYPEIARLSEGLLGSRRRMTKAPDFVESVWETRETPMNRYTLYIYNYNYMYIIYVYIYVYHICDVCDICDIHHFNSQFFKSMVFQSMFHSSP